MEMTAWRCSMAFPCERGYDRVAADLVLIGSGGFGRETAQAIRVVNDCGRGGWRLLGYLDDDTSRHGTVVEGVPVLGGRDGLRDMPDARVVVCTGRPGDYVSRLRIVAELGLPPERYATIVHPSATVSSSSVIGPGSVLLAHVALTTAVRVGSHVAIMPHVTLTHDVVIDDFVTIASGVRIGGGVRVARGAYLGAGAIIGEHLTIGEFSLAGMGAVVTRDIPDREVWVGVPARRIRPAEINMGSAYGHGGQNDAAPSRQSGARRTSPGP
jgi:sugar O-acyltransferase (sialic acid O-acetyltransferase NeuD family)